MVTEGPGGAATDQPTQAQDEIRDVLADYDRFWRALDMRSLFRLWDQDEQEPVYIGGEYPAPVIGRGELGRHWGRLGGRITLAQTTSSLLHCRLLAPDIAMVVYLCEWEFETADSDLHNSGQDWVTAVLRRREQGWRFIHQAESATFNAHTVPADADTRE
jgi:ketosteroid isomerase-like protein